jgi:prephenate dehydratase
MRELARTNFPQLIQESMSSTAAAAEAVSKADGTIAAIASSAAARVYQLQVLFPNIQDEQHNVSFLLRGFLHSSDRKKCVR